MNRVLCLLLLVAVACGCAYAQTWATLQGTVTDSSDAVVPNVKIELKSAATGAVRTTVATSEGIFRFNEVAPGRYDMTVRPGSGFKEFVMNQIVLNASETRELGRIKLTVGTVTEEVQVTAAATPVQTASSENTSMVDFDQMAEVKVRGRDLMSMLQTIPGANFGTTFLTQGGSGQSNYETENPFALGALNLNGAGSSANYTVDGVTAMDMAGDSLSAIAPNVDAVAEIRVLSTNYSAEFGRDLGGQVQVVTKGGTQEFHGSVNDNKRHEQFNANSFFNNYNGLQKSLYRFNILTYTIGGPLYIPKHFNKQKKRAFFFFSQEYLQQKSNPATGYANVPNANQLKGDFSYYPASNGNFIANSLRNPVTGAFITPWSGAASGTPYAGQGNFAQFAPDFSAASQKYGQAMMADLPAPNLCNAASGTSDGNVWNGIAAGQQGSNLISPTNCPSFITSQTTGLSSGNIDLQGGPGTTNNNTRNYFWTYTGPISRRNDVARVDLNITSKLTAYGRFDHDHYLDSSAGSIPLRSTTNNQFSPTFEPHPNPGRGWAVGTTYTITPTLVDQLTLGYSWNDYAYILDPTKLDPKNMGSPPSFHNFATDPLYNQPPVQRPELGLGQPFYAPGIPNVTYGGGQWSETGDGQPFCNGTCPNFNYNPLYSIANSISKTIGSHNLKAGISYEWNQKQESGGSGTAQGAYSFSGTSNDFFSNNTLDGFANAYLGNIASYSEGQRVVGYKTSQSVEAFIQDNWRATRRLTLDLGVRFSHLPAMQDIRGNMAIFDPSTYSASQTERILLPYCSISTATGTCPAADSWSWDKAENPNATVGTGMGGPGNMYPSYVAAGTLVPVGFNNGSSVVATGGYSGTTNPYTGMQILTDKNTQFPLGPGIYQVARFAPAPRIGFAYDVFGNGKTAIRGGFGENLQRLPNALMNGDVGAVPDTLGLTQYFGNVASIATNPLAGYIQSALPAANSVIGLSPLNASWLQGYQKLPTSYNGSLQVQQDLGFSTVLQVGYVFMDERHVELNTTLNNNTAFGTLQGWGSLWPQYAQAAQDPTKAYLAQYWPGNNASGGNLNDNYFRSEWPGYGTVTGQNFAGSNDYSSLQASLRRNFTKRLSFSAAYTWSKTMSLAGGRSSVFSDKYRNWGPSFSPTPMYLTLTYVYRLPNVSTKLGFKPMKWVTDDWEVSGLTQIRGDVPAGIPTLSLANTNSTSLDPPNTTGSTEGARMWIVGNPNLAKGSYGFVGGPTTTNIGVNGTPGNAIFNNSAFMLPNPCSLTAQAGKPQLGVGENMECFGNAGTGSLLSIPGTHLNDWDMSFIKHFPLKSEKRTLEFRCETYNIFNHTSFLGAATGQSWDMANYRNGVLVPTNGSTGRYTSAANPRLMSMALKFTF